MLYSISEFAELTGVTTQTLRNWESSGKLIPIRTGGDIGHRRYSQEQLDKILQKDTTTKGTSIDKKTFGYFKVNKSIDVDTISSYYDKLRGYISNTYEENFDILCDVFETNKLDLIKQEEILTQVTQHKIRRIVFLCAEPIDYYEFKALSRLLTKLDIEVVILKNNVLNKSFEFDDILTSIQDIAETKSYNKEDIVEIVTILESNLKVPTVSKITELD